MDEHGTGVVKIIHTQKFMALCHICHIKGDHISGVHQRDCSCPRKVAEKNTTPQIKMYHALSTCHRLLVDYAQLLKMTWTATGWRVVVENC